MIVIKDSQQEKNGFLHKKINNILIWLQYEKQYLTSKL